MLKIYGTANSRAARSLWAAEELGLNYEHIPTSVGDSRKPEFLKLNPNGHIPAIDDDGHILCESMAINLYLAEKYGKAPFWPADVRAHGEVYQWSFWGMMETEAHMLALLTHKLFLPAEQRSEAAVKSASEAIKAPLKVLDDHLKGREYLLGKDFTVADLNVASVLVLGNFIQFDFSLTPAVHAWLGKCLSRPAMQKAMQMK
jgi:glutathione S-transferase